MTVHLNKIKERLQTILSLFSEVTVKEKGDHSVFLQFSYQEFSFFVEVKSMKERYLIAMGWYQKKDNIKYLLTHYFKQSKEYQNMILSYDRVSEMAKHGQWGDFDHSIQIRLNSVLENYEKWTAEPELEQKKREEKEERVKMVKQRLGQTTVSIQSNRICLKFDEISDDMLALIEKEF